MSESVPARGRTRRARLGAPGRSWQRDPEGRRLRILDAAAAEIARVGARAVRVEDVARAAAVAEGTVYYLFGSKRALLVAVGEAYGDGLARAAFGGLPPDFHPRDVRRIVEGIFAYVRATPGPLTAFLLMTHPEEGGPARDASRARMLVAIESALSAWQRRGWIAALDQRIAAELHFGLVESAVRECFLRGGGRDEDAWVRETARGLAAMLGQGVGDAATPARSA